MSNTRQRKSEQLAAAVLWAKGYAEDGVHNPTELKENIPILKGAKQYAKARKLLERAVRDPVVHLWANQELAMCTYKDETLPPAKRFHDALRILEHIGLRDISEADPETLSLGGAVYKRLWDREGQMEHLYESLVFYRAAYCTAPEKDLGYGGVNAAYILDLLAARARLIAVRNHAESSEEQTFVKEARELREDMAGRLPDLIEQRLQAETDDEKRYWYCVTMAEVFFGCHDFAKAGHWLGRAKQLDPKEWMLQTSARQLISIAKHHDYPLPPDRRQPGQWTQPWSTLASFLGVYAATALDGYRGKVGLALSGGGFRASLYHLGVLARLADMDALRSVECLSTVSGGSIVGAHYYLELQRLLESATDEELLEKGKAPYVEAVGRVIADFVAGVQKNIRTRAIANPIQNIKMIFSERYSRSHRLGELYEEQIYSRVKDGHKPGQPRYMHELNYRPKGEPEGFDPAFSNWHRSAKVPALLLNATSLNSGHNWRFTSTGMGEPAGLVDGEVDMNRRYECVEYKDESSPLPKELENYRLGYAVAASACVPGLFEPLVINGLYGADTKVRLVDGGVHDNQGVAALLDEGCTLLLCSDASGQMGDLANPSDSLVRVPLRANSILMDRVREAEYQDLRNRADNHALEGLFFIHLKKDLPLETLAPFPGEQEAATPRTTPYGFDAELQAQLAAIRTDLDSFTEVEANALMLSGYLTTETHFRELQKDHKSDGQAGTWGEFDIDAGRGNWSFLDLESMVAEPAAGSTSARKDLGLQVQVAAELFFKVFRLYPALKFAAVGLAVALVAGFAWWLYDGNWGRTPFEDYTIGNGVTILGLLLVGLVLPSLARALKPLETVIRWLRRFAIAILGSFVAAGHLYVFDKLFLRRGSVRRLLKKR